MRARVRAELTEEIKAAARRRLATDGANLVLRAVARDLGMVPSALYRYFASRDELLTALIADAYNALGAEAAEAEARVKRGDLRGRWVAVCRATRDWALANPAEYTLIYGSPVPGYAAPSDTVFPASRVILLLIAILTDGSSTGTTAAKPARRRPAALRPDLDSLLARWPADSPTPAPSGPKARAVLSGALTAWVHLFGLISFEVFGRLDDMIVARADHFDHQMHLMADVAGLPQ